MHLNLIAKDILSQLKQAIDPLSDDDYSRTIDTLSGSTIGQHVRHTLEFFLCLQSGILTGIVNYDSRRRDKKLEESKHSAQEAIFSLLDKLDGKNEDYSLRLVGCYGEGQGHKYEIESNYLRELAYNIEHAIHHMALIKIGIKVLHPELKLPDGFGVASSTVRFQNS